MYIMPDAYLLFCSIVVSYVFGRLSLRKGKYTGWYERFVDHSELIFLIQNAVVFFTSSLCFVLLLLSVHIFGQDYTIAIGLGIMLVLYLLIILIVNFTTNSQKKAPMQAEEDRLNPNKPETNTLNSNEDGGTQPKKLLLRFLSVFSLVLGVCLFVSPVILLICKSSQIIAESYSLSIQECCYFMIDIHAPFSVLTAFLLVLTSITGLILAAKTITLSRSYPIPGPTGEERKRNELQKRIRNR